MIHPSRAAVAVLLLLGLAACSGGGSGSGSGGHSASSQGGFKPVSNDRGDLSSKFPMPSDITGMQSSSVDGRTYVNMHLKNGPADYDFWTSKLRQAGYTVTEADKSADGGMIYFNGNGYSSGIIAATAQAATITVKK